MPLRKTEKHKYFILFKILDLIQTCLGYYFFCTSSELSIFFFQDEMLEPSGNNIKKFGVSSLHKSSLLRFRPYFRDYEGIVCVYFDMFCDFYINISVSSCGENIFQGLIAPINYKDPLVKQQIYKFNQLLWIKLF